MKQVVTRIVTTGKIMPGVHLTWLEAPEIAIQARPGQFVMVRCGGDTILPRPLSVHQLDGDKIALLFNVVGKGTEWLSQRQENNTVELFGPLGNGFSINPDSHNLLLVAGGIGIAPLYYLAREALTKKRSVTLLYGTADKNRYPISPQIKVVSTTEDGTFGHRGMITDIIPEFVDQADQIFACGPISMYKTMAQMPELRGKPVQVSLEVRMGCGRGICYGCTINTRAGLKKVCQDGPVFDLDDILWNEQNFS